MSLLTKGSSYVEIHRREGGVSDVAGITVGCRLSQASQGAYRHQSYLPATFIAHFFPSFVFLSTLVDDVPTFLCL